MQRPKTKFATCARCSTWSPHRFRSPGKLESACRRCKREAAKAWRERNALRAKLRNTWMGIRERTGNPKHPKFRLYGGAGVRMCDRWRDDFGLFVLDVGLPPSAEHTIDRYPDHAGDYEPGNVRWATYSEQNRNREANRFITHEGVTRCLVDWGARLNIPWQTIQTRLDRGDTVAEAFGLEEVPF